jgi:hypothetical protein
MRYVLLIYDDPDVWAAMPQEESNAYYAEYGAYSEELAKAGAFVAGDALQSTTAATTVRVRDGQTLATDGPFAETKEQLGGYYVIDAANLDEALAWAAKIPSSRVGSIEVRPVLDMSGPSQG